jgi:hypothetical protein
MGIEVAGVGHHGAMHKLGQLRLELAAPWRPGQMVVAQAPAGVEGHAEAMHGPLPEKGFKAQLGGHHIDRRRRFDQGCWVAPIAHHQQPRILQIRWPEMAALATGGHIGMDLEHHPVLRMVCQGGRQHALEAGGISQSGLNREIPGRLIHHQHEGLSGGPGFRRPVVFAHSLLAPEPAQILRPLPLGWGEGLADQVFQPAGAAGVVVDASIVHHHGEGRTVGPESDRAQKAILTAPQRHAPLLCEEPGALGRGLQAPAQHGIERPTPAGAGSCHQGGRSQQGLQGTDAGHAAGGNPETGAAGKGEIVGDGLGQGTLLPGGGTGGSMPRHPPLWPGGGARKAA